MKRGKLCPQVHQRRLRLAFPVGRPTGLPRSAPVTILSDLGSTNTPEVLRSRRGNRYAPVLTLSYPSGCLPFWSRRFSRSDCEQYLAPVLRDDACGGSHMLAVSPDPSPCTAWYWQLAPPLTFLVPTLAGAGTLSQRLRTPWALRKVVFPMTHALVGYRWRNIRLHPNGLVVTVTCATSCRKMVA